ncbi:MAG: hypothetical protein ISR01_03285 [Chitinophagales bacterium]|nr:hypothetical protein [Chitinophagales bacterium]
MRCLIFFLVFLFSFYTLPAQSFIDFQQRRIDLLDGTEDQKLANYENSEVFFEQVDKLQEILLKQALSSDARKQIQLGIYFSLVNFKKTSSLNSSKALSYKFLEIYLMELGLNKSAYFFKANPSGAYTILPYIYTTKEAQQFLELEAQINPQIVLKNYSLFASASYAPALLSTILHIDPISSKQYFIGRHAIYQELRISENKTDSLILNIFNQTGSSSNALSLLQSIADGNISIEEANNIAKLNSEHFFLKLVELAPRPNILAKQSIDKLLKTICTRKTRFINALFENHNDEQRFSSISKYSAKELYHIITYSEEEIFTSSFNGMFKNLLEKTQEEKINTFELLESVQFNQYRTFIKMCISYGKLEDLLAQMSDINREDLLGKFVKLGNEKSLLKEAVSVADALGSITDSLTLYQIEKSLLTNYTQAKDEELKLVYSLLMKLYENKTSTYRNEYLTYTNQLEVPSIKEISKEDLLGNDSIHTQVHCFYDDEDGKTSYQTFMRLWSKNDWHIQDYREFVTISSVHPIPIQILVNKPQYDYEGQKLIKQLLDEKEADIEVLVHRGHSFYVPRSLIFLRDETRIVFLGSCGGYHSVYEILNQSPFAHIISTKQIGTYTVNNPLLLAITEQVESGETIQWDKFWEQFSSSFQEGTYAYQKMIEYVPPHQNLGAAFIQAFRNNYTLLD